MRIDTSLSIYQKALLKELGPDYRKQLFDLEQVIYRDLGTYDIEISGGHRKKDPFAIYMNVVTHNKLLDKFRNSPYKLLTHDDYQGFQLLNKPIVFSNDMPCGSTRNEVAILYGDFSQVEVLQQGTDPVQEHECITFPGTVEVSMDGYAQVRLLDRQSVKGLRVIEKEDTACKKSPSA